MALGELLQSYLLNETPSAAKPTSVVNHPRITRVDSMVKVRSSANDQSASRQQLFGVHGACAAIELPGSLFSACVQESSERAVISPWNFGEADSSRPYTSLLDTRLGESPCRRASRWGAGSSIRPSTACLPKARPFASSRR